jgi:hypothetical protein
MLITLGIHRSRSRLWVVLVQERKPKVALVFEPCLVAAVYCRQRGSTTLILRCMQKGQENVPFLARFLSVTH